MLRPGQTRPLASISDLRTDFKVVGIEPRNTGDIWTVVETQGDGTLRAWTLEVKKCALLRQPCLTVPPYCELQVYYPDEKTKCVDAAVDPTDDGGRTDPPGERAHGRVPQGAAVAVEPGNEDNGTGPTTDSGDNKWAVNSQRGGGNGGNALSSDPWTTGRCSGNGDNAPAHDRWATDRGSGYDGPDRDHDKWATGSSGHWRSR